MSPFNEKALKQCLRGLVFVLNSTYYYARFVSFNHENLNGHPSSISCKFSFRPHY